MRKHRKTDLRRSTRGGRSIHPPHVRMGPWPLRPPDGDPEAPPDNNGLCPEEEDYLWTRQPPPHET